MFGEPLNSVVLDILFVMALFHGLAKLRLHTTSTRAFFRAVTADIGEKLRSFEEASKGYKTKELESEKARRLKRQAKAKSKKDGKGKGKDVEAAENPPTTNIPTAKKEKGLNLKTYKTHELGHFADDIECHGTLDLCNTQEVRTFALLRS